MGYTAIMSFVTNWRNLVIVALIAACVVFFLKGLQQRSEIVSLKDTIAVQKGQLADNEMVNAKLKTANAQLEFDKGKIQTDLNLANSSVTQLNIGIEALQAQVKKLFEDSSYWYKKAQDAGKTLGTTTTTDQQKLIEKGKVIDEESSRKIINQINTTMSDSTRVDDAGSGV